MFIKKGGKGGAFTIQDWTLNLGRQNTHLEILHLQTSSHYLHRMLDEFHLKHDYSEEILRIENSAINPTCDTFPVISGITLFIHRNRRL